MEGLRGWYKGETSKLTQTVVTARHSPGAKTLMHELETCAPLEHRNIIETIGGCWNEDFDDGANLDRVAIVFELATRGSLADYITKGFEMCQSMFLDVALGMQYLHSKRISLIHRDLKPENVLLNARLTAKISDFGTAIVPRASWGSRACGTPVGTINYCAPEIVTGSAEASTASDVFSFGIMLLVSVMKKSAREIGESKDTLHKLHSKGERFDIPGQIIQDHPRVSNLITLCCAQDAQNRSDFDDIAKEIRKWRIRSPVVMHNRDLTCSMPVLSSRTTPGSRSASKLPSLRSKVLETSKAPSSHIADDTHN